MNIFRCYICIFICQTEIGCRKNIWAKVITPANPNDGKYHKWPVRIHMREQKKQAAHSAVKTEVNQSVKKKYSLDCFLLCRKNFDRTLD